MKFRSHFYTMGVDALTRTVDSWTQMWCQHCRKTSKVNSIDQHVKAPTSSVDALTRTIDASIQMPVELLIPLTESKAPTCISMYQLMTVQLSLRHNKLTGYISIYMV